MKLFQSLLYADGIEWSNRSLMPHDLPPQAELSDSEQYHLDGSEDHILVDLVDADDPNATYQFELASCGQVQVCKSSKGGCHCSAGFGSW